MLRFDKAVTFLSTCKSNLSVSFNFNICGLGVLFYEFINIVSIFYNDFIKLLYTFLVISFDWYSE